MTTQRLIWLATILLIGIALVDLVVGMVAAALAPGLSLVVLGTINGSVAALAMILLLTRFGMWQRVGFRALAHPLALLWFIPLLLYALLPLSQGVSINDREAPVAVIFALTIAFWKVTAIILATYMLRELGAWRAAGLSALLFGLIHLLGLVVGGALLPTVANAVASGLLGFHFAALYLRTGLSWPAVLLYALLLLAVAWTGGLDAPNMATSVEALLPAIVISAILAGIGALALATRPRNKQTLQTAAR